MWGRLILGLLFAVFAGMGAIAGSLAADRAVKAEIVRTRPLIEFRRTPAIIHLEKGNFPVMAEALESSGDGPVNLMIVDPGLTDFHQKFPRPMETPGNYIFTVTPKTSCSYRVWAEIKPSGGHSQIAVTDLKGSEDCGRKEVERTLNMEAESGNYSFKLTFDHDRLQAETPVQATIMVRDRNGRYIDELQPVMGAFGHLTGFYDDFSTVFSALPEDEKPASYTDLGGPTLSFSLTPPKGGYMKIFLRTRINDQDVIASFGVLVNKKIEVFNDFSENSNEHPLDEEYEESLTEDDLMEDDFIEDEKERTVNSAEAERPVRDDLDEILEEETRQLKAERMREQQEHSELDGLYTGAGPSRDVEIYEDIDEKTLEKDGHAPADGERLVPSSLF